jgi:phage host-nuclease inhibitor protein Gam
MIFLQKLVKAQENASAILKTRIALEQESKELETKLSAEQNALKANLVASQQAVSEGNELKSKLAAAQEAHTRDLDLLKKEQEVLQQGVAEYQEVSKQSSDSFKQFNRRNLTHTIRRCSRRN